ncbi:2,3-diphosphoglycerate-dependent phosphoglycerate mutase GpmB [Dactylosporangium fulvum]|uniref:Histidine phosphatase family protein n=1 Tax=Dactylosporangium fulvum TaxID=53359 RepID=A0ABY5VR83_9ACTN|nr:histidine phosphatase family protein [Dactylosporangium fulvum]UWP79644.1 histidine phosphatase family protein [Dactylosporangium fulvum]
MRTVALARHGRTAWHAPNRYTGRSDIELDDVGVRQAEALARWAAGRGFAALASSDLRRAVDTAAAAAATTGLVPTADPRLRELDFGIAEGHTLADLDPAVAERFVSDPVTHHFPGGEHPARAVDRFHAGLAALSEQVPDGSALVVAHSTIIRLVVCAALGLPLAEYRRRLPVLDPTAVTTLRLSEDGVPVALLAYNVPVSEGWQP